MQLTIRNCGTQPATKVEVDVATEPPVEIIGQTTFQIQTVMHTRGVSLPAVKVRLPREFGDAGSRLKVTVLCAERVKPEQTLINFRVAAVAAEPFHETDDVD